MQREQAVARRYTQVQQEQRQRQLHEAEAKLFEKQLTQREAAVAAREKKVQEMEEALRSQEQQLAARLCQSQASHAAGSLSPDASGGLAPTVEEEDIEAPARSGKKQRRARGSGKQKHT